MVTTPSPIELEKMLRTAFRSFHQKQVSAKALAELFSFKQRNPDGTNDPRETTNSLLRDLVAELERHDPLSAELLSRRFFDGEKMLAIYTA